MRNLRVLTPLFSSFGGISRSLSSTFKTAFWKLCHAILDKARKGAIFESDIVFRDEEEYGDNYDRIRETAGKLCIIRPVLRQKLFVVTMSRVRPHCVNMVRNVITSLRPTGSSKVEVAKAKSLSDDEMLPGWIQVLGGKEGAQGDKVGNAIDEQKKTTGTECKEKEKCDEDKPTGECEKEQELPTGRTKKRLMRHTSEWGELPDKRIRRYDTRIVIIGNVENDI